jgi:hypothetical protein
VEFTAKESRLSAYVFCFTRDIQSTIPKIKERMGEELQERKLRFDNVEKHLDLWL